MSKLDDILSNHTTAKIKVDNIFIILPVSTFFQQVNDAWKMTYWPLYTLVSNLTKVVDVVKVPTSDGRVKFWPVVYNNLAKQYLTPEVIAGIKSLGGEVLWLKK